MLSETEIPYLCLSIQAFCENPPVVEDPFFEIGQKTLFLSSQLTTWYYQIVHGTVAHYYASCSR